MGALLLFARTTDAQNPDESNEAFTRHVSGRPFEKILRRMFDKKNVPRGVDAWLFGIDDGVSYSKKSIFRGAPKFWSKKTRFIPYNLFFQWEKKDLSKLTADLDTSPYEQEINEGFRFQEDFLNKKLMEARTGDPLNDEIMTRVENLFRKKRLRRVSIQDKPIPEPLAERRARDTFRLKYGHEVDLNVFNQATVFKNLLHRERQRETTLHRNHQEERELSPEELAQELREVIAKISEALERPAYSDSFTEITNFSPRKKWNVSLKNASWGAASFQSTAGVLKIELESLLADLPHLAAGQLKGRMEKTRLHLLGANGQVRVQVHDFSAQLYDYESHDANLMRPFIGAHWWGFSQKADYWPADSEAKLAFSIIGKPLFQLARQFSYSLFYVAAVTKTVVQLPGSSQSGERLSLSTETVGKAHNKLLEKDRALFSVLGENKSPAMFDLITGEEAKAVLETGNALPIANKQKSERTFFWGDSYFKAGSGGLLPIPTPPGNRIVATTLLTRDYQILRSGEDFTLHQDPKSGRAFLKFRSPQSWTQSYRFSEVQFESEPSLEPTPLSAPPPIFRSALEKKIFEIDSDKLMQFARELEEAGFLDFSYDITSLVEKQKALGHSYVELQDLVEGFSKRAQYQDDGKSGRKRWFPRNIAQEFAHFAMDGKACMQCDGGNSFMTAFLNSYYGPNSGIEVRPVVGLPYKDNHLWLPAHQQSEIYVLGKRVVRFDATPRAKQPQAKPQPTWEIFPALKVLREMSPTIIADRWRKQEAERAPAFSRDQPTESPPDWWKSPDARDREMDQKIEDLRRAHISETLKNWVRSIDGEIAELKKEITSTTGKRVRLSDSSSPWSQKFALLVNTKAYLEGSLSKEELFDIYGSPPEDTFLNLFKTQSESIRRLLQESLRTPSLVAQYPFLRDERVQELLRSEYLEKIFQKSLLPLDHIPVLRRFCDVFAPR